MKSTPNPKTPPQLTPIKSADREQMYLQTMTNIRYQLPKGLGGLSRFLHGRVVELVSEFLEETVFRPSIVLGGLLGAVVITSVWYGFARVFGFELAGSELPISFAIGAILGFGIERLLLLFKPRE